MNDSAIFSKIKTWDEINLWRKNLRKQEKKLVFTNGCFDILHRGHVSYLIKASQIGDALIVAINSDRSVKLLKGESRPVTQEDDRALIMACLEFIDAVVIFDSIRCDKLIRTVQPDIYVKAGDYDIETLDASEKQALNDVNSDIRFIPFSDGYSSTAIINKMNKT